MKLLIKHTATNEFNLFLTTFLSEYWCGLVWFVLALGVFVLALDLLCVWLGLLWVGFGSGWGCFWVQGQPKFFHHPTAQAHARWQQWCELPRPMSNGSR